MRKETNDEAVLDLLLVVNKNFHPIKIWVFLWRILFADPIVEHVHEEPGIGFLARHVPLISWATVTEGTLQLMNEKCLENFLVVVIIAFPDVLEEMFYTSSEMNFHMLLDPSDNISRYVVAFRTRHPNLIERK